MRKLAGRFVAAADEVWFLQNRKGPECEFFKGFCEEGHYGGRTRPTNTRQGIYCCTPSGRFLASVNSTDPRRVATMLEQALDAWRKTRKKDRYLEAAPDAGAAAQTRGEARYPTGGLVLKVYTRDLPRAKKPGRGWRGVAWNQDFAWFREAEARSFLPERPRKGARHAVPAKLARRLARCHLVDNVRGQTRSYQDPQVESAELTAVITAVVGTRVELRLEGATRAASPGWGNRERGMETKLLGKATFDLAGGRFVAFEMVAVASRWGATRYNAREDDPGPAPMGVLFVLAGDSPAERVAPAFLHSYGW